MKKIILLICLLILYRTLFSQIYRSQYDPYDNGVNNGNGYSFWINVYNQNLGYALHNGAQQLESYLVMFKSTHDKRYLDKFIIESVRIQRHRDNDVNQYKQDIVSGAGSDCYLLSAIPDDGNS